MSSGRKGSATYELPIFVVGLGSTLSPGIWVLDKDLVKFGHVS